MPAPEGRKVYSNQGFQTTRGQWAPAVFRQTPRILPALSSAVNRYTRIAYCQKLVAMFFNPVNLRSIQNGFSLIEVLVAGAILSTGLAGLAALLMSSVSGTAQTAHQSIALMLADNMSASMALSSRSVDTFLGAPPSVAPNCDVHSACTSRQFAEASFQAWDVQVRRTLPGGRGVVCRDDSPDDGTPGNPACSGSGPVVVKIFWQVGAPDGPAGGRLVRVVNT